MIKYSEFRPIKSDREKFIQAGLAVWFNDLKACIDVKAAKGDLGMLFDADFKAPEDKQ